MTHGIQAPGTFALKLCYAGPKTCRRDAGKKGASHMPVFRERLTVGLVRGLKAFLNLDAGLTRGEVPDPERALERTLKQRDEYQRQLQQTKKQLARKNRQLEQAKLRQGEQKSGQVGKRGRKGNRPKQEAREHLLARVPKNSVCAEIGVDEGQFSRQILDSTTPKRLHLIDPYKHHEHADEYERSRYGGLGSGGQTIMDERHEKVRERFAREIRSGQVQMHRNFSNEISDDFEDSYFDWIYIDGNHLHKFVRQDLKLYYPKVRPGGYITGDDYGIEGWWENGVQQAVDEFISQNPDAALEVRGSQFIIHKGEQASSMQEPVDRARKAQRNEQATNDTGGLPDFLMIGAQKGGTGFLFRLLSRHPHVEPAAFKEVSFFSNYFDRGVDWYRSYFPPPTHKDGRKVLSWEGSPNYLLYPHAARRAAEIVGHAKLIVLLRNPVDRAYSHYNHQVRMGHEPLSSFEEALEAEEGRLRGARERMLENEHYNSVNFPRFSYVSRGLYADQLAEWHKYFDESRMLILESEDLRERTGDTVDRILNFLNLPDWEPENARRPKPKYRYEPMRPETRQRLEEYFAPHNERLYDYLGKDFGW